MALGFTAWIAAFSMLYALQATGCEFSWHKVWLGPVSAIHATLYGLLVVQLGLLLALLVRCRRKLGDSERGSLEAFLWRASTLLTLSAVAATLWIGIALPLPSICK